MNLDEDEFDAFDLSEFTEDDLRRVDADLARITSPFRTFQSKKHFAVTDLVGPAWCEVQYEYDLYGLRRKPIHLRPREFRARSGKHIAVQQHVAQSNDRRLKRGKSVHKALHVELSPNQVVVRTANEEERFGVRQLVDGFAQLVTDGITRELPVFTITHGQVVIGTIDEVLRVQTDPPAPSSSPPNKRQRLDDDPYEFHIRDYKTRRAPNVPLDQDSLSPRLQLMLYHRMLSASLNPKSFDFDLLWNKLGLDPAKPFSARFAKDIGWEQRRADPSDDTVHLNRLVALWTATVQRQHPQLRGVNPQLQLVYRQSPDNQSLKGKQASREPVEIEDPLEALMLREELDLSRAIEQSLSDLGHQQASQLASKLAQNVIQAGPSSIGHTSAVWETLVSPSDSDQSDDPAMAWAIQQSLLTCAHEARAQASETPVRSPDVHDKITVDASPIIGTKEFDMDDTALDAHLTDVLQWWFGERPPRGVYVSQTNRCFTCEYQDSCEWREKKAREALTLATKQRATQKDETSGGAGSIWPIE